MSPTTERKTAVDKDREFAEKRELVRDLLGACEENQKVWRILVRDWFDGYVDYEFLPELNPDIPELHLLHSEVIFIDKAERHHANLHASVTCADGSVRMSHIHAELDPESEHVVIHRPHINTYRLDGNKPNTKIKLPAVTRNAFKDLKEYLRPLTVDELKKQFSQSNDQPEPENDEGTSSSSTAENVVMKQQEVYLTPPEEDVATPIDAPDIMAEGLVEDDGVQPEEDQPSLEESSDKEEVLVDGLIDGKPASEHLSEE